MATATASVPKGKTEEVDADGGAKPSVLRTARRLWLAPGVGSLNGDAGYFFQHGLLRSYDRQASASELALEKLIAAVASQVGAVLGLMLLQRLLGRALCAIFLLTLAGHLAEKLNFISRRLCGRLAPSKRISAVQCLIHS